MAPHRSLRHLTRKPIGFLEYRKLISQIPNMTDQSVVLMCTAMLERTLEKNIRLRLRRLTKKEHSELFIRGPLSSFAAQIRMAHALSRFGPKTFAELETIREIRNAFAHATHPITFTTKRVAERCRSLRMNNVTYPPMLEHLFQLPLSGASPRDQFVRACVVLWFTLSLDTRPWRPKRYTGPGVLQKIIA